LGAVYKKQQPDEQIQANKKRVGSQDINVRPTSFAAQKPPVCRNTARQDDRASEQRYGIAR
jgi:hypothetical protein